MIIPKLFNGRDKLFFFFSFDGFDDRKTTGSANPYTLPTLPERQGNFSDLLPASSTLFQIYDPLSIQSDPSRPGHYVRSPFPGNIVPQSRIVNPVYQNYLKLLPDPNNPPASANLQPLNNYVDPSQPYNWFYEAFANRIDYQLSNKNRFFARWNWLKYREDRQDWTHTTDRGVMTNGVNRNNLGITADWVYTASASTVFDFEAGANNFREGNILTAKALAFTPSSVGLPSYMDTKAGTAHALPVMAASGYATMGQSVPAWTYFEYFALKGNVFHVRGSHTFRAGIDARDHRRDDGAPGNANGLFNFTNALTCQEDDCLTAGSSSLGLSWASFMMGLPANSNVDTNSTYAFTNPYFGWYGQDTWRVTPKLTLTLGLRMEYEFGIKERYNRYDVGFNPTATLPITALAEAAYAQNPVPEMSPSAFSVVGGSLYAGKSGLGARYPAGELMWLPRIGFAYDFSKFVIRGGYGIYRDTLNSLNQSPDQSGFSRTTTDTSTDNFGLIWNSGNPTAGISPMTDPFPVRADGTRFDLPVGSALGLMSRDGTGWTFLDPNFKRTREQRWSVDVQRQFGANTMVSVAYWGMWIDNLRITKAISALPGQYWATGNSRNNAVATNLNQNVPNPFYIKNFASLQTSDPVTYQALASRSFFTSPTIRKYQLLEPFPQMNGTSSTTLLNETGPYGAEKAHAIEAVVMHRLSHGLTFTANFTGLYERDRDYYFHPYDASPSWERHALSGCSGCHL